VNPLIREFDKIEEDLRPYAKTFRARAGRFAAIFFPALVTTLIAAHQNLTLGLLLSTGLSVAVAALAEIDPGVPWSAIVSILEHARYRSNEPLTVSRQPPTSPPRSGT